MDARRDTYYAIACESKPGALAQINADLMQAKVCLLGIWGFDRQNAQSEVYVIPEDNDTFKSVAAKKGWKISEHACFRLEGEDSTGALVETLNMIAKRGISLMAVDAITLGGQFGCYLWPKDEDVQELEEVLGLRSFLA